MRPQENNPASDDGTRTLHLGKFAHGQSAPTTPVKSADDSPTLMIKRATQAVAEGGHCQIILPHGINMSPAEILGALSYCYAKGVFTSAEIEAKMLADPTFREALKNEVPRPEVLRKFRKLNHAAIIAVLEKYYAARHHQAKAAKAHADESITLPDSSGGTTIIFSKKQAHQRLNDAMMTDSLSQDE